MKFAITLLLCRVNDYSVSSWSFSLEITRNESLEMRSTRHVLVYVSAAPRHSSKGISKIGRTRIKSQLYVPCPSDALDRHSETLNLRGELLILNRRCVRVHVHTRMLVHTRIRANHRHKCEEGRTHARLTRLRRPCVHKNSAGRPNRTRLH